jgi:D-amino-acid dehydrogenase
MYYANGGEWQLLSAHEAKAKDSSLSKIKNMIGAAWTPSDWVGDIHKFCYELAKILEKKYNVVFCYNCDVSLLEYLTNNYDAVIVSAGVGSEKLANSIGDSLNIYPVKGYSITINNVDPKYLPKVSLLDDQAKIVTSSLGNRFRVAGTAELNGENYDILRDRIKPLLKWVHTNFPDINTNDYSSWACLRPMTPNMMPITKQSDKNKKVYYNTGHGHLGWTLAPYTAKFISGKI